MAKVVKRTELEKAPEIVTDPQKLLTYCGHRLEARRQTLDTVPLATISTNVNDPVVFRRQLCEPIKEGQNRYGILYEATIPYDDSLPPDERKLDVLRRVKPVVDSVAKEMEAQGYSGSEVMGCRLAVEEQTSNMVGANRNSLHVKARVFPDAMVFELRTLRRATTTDADGKQAPSPVFDFDHAVSATQQFLQTATGEDRERVADDRQQRRTNDPEASGSAGLGNLLAHPGRHASSA